MRLLVVDDHHDTVLTLVKLIESFGHEVRMASDGFQALEIAGAWKPECVLLDIGLPKMDGYVLAEKLRSESGLDGARIIALSGYAKNAARFAEAGLDDYLIKPVNLADLLRVIDGSPPTQT